MGEISAVAAARAAVLRNEDQTRRDGEVQGRERLEAERQERLDRGDLLAREVEARRQARSQTLRGDIRTDEEDRRFFEDKEQVRRTQLRDQAFAATRRAIEVEIFRADELNREFEEPPVTERRIVGFERSAEDIARERDELNRTGPEPPPAAPAPAERQALEPLQPFERPPEGIAAPAAPLEPFERPTARPADTDATTLRALEQERLERVGDRRRADRTFDARQDQDLRDATRRIAEGPQDPGVPRGSVVDIFG